MYRISVDTGGTFTDVVVADNQNNVYLTKALTTAERAYTAIAEGLEDVASTIGCSTSDLVKQATELKYGTTRSTNLVVTNRTAKTALLTTKGFPDVLLLREGGKPGPFRHMAYRGPLIPRYLTFEIDERVTSTGDVFRELQEQSVRDAIESCRDADVEAIAVSLLWSVANPEHEIRIGKLLETELPGIPFTLSHHVNPSVREYRRTSSAAIDASLKPSMQVFFSDLEQDLRMAGFIGSLLISTSNGGGWDAERIADRPVYSIGSGPSMAPVAALREAAFDAANGASESTLLVTDMGGTTFDLSVVQDGRIAQTSETWLGGKWVGDITGTRSVDVESIGAGGGSIIWIDAGGLLKVGPQSAGSEPGPVCYGRGGTEPTITDAALVLGYLDSSNFLSGRLKLDTDAARSAISGIADNLGRTVEETAQAAMAVSVDNIVTAIREKTVARGIDVRTITLVAGGGASGISVGLIAGALHVGEVIVPKAAGAMSAYGALYADAMSEFEEATFTSTRKPGFTLDASITERLLASANDFFKSLHPSIAEVSKYETEFYCHARYPMQAWELTVTLGDEATTRSSSGERVEDLFHAEHQRVFGVREEDERAELLALGVRARAVSTRPVEKNNYRSINAESSESVTTRLAYFKADGWVSTPVYSPEELHRQGAVNGPAIVREPTTTIVVYPGQVLSVRDSSNYTLTKQNEETS